MPGPWRRGSLVAEPPKDDLSIESVDFRALRTERNSSVHELLASIDPEACDAALGTVEDMNFEEYEYSEYYSYDEGDEADHNHHHLHHDHRHSISLNGSGKNALGGDDAFSDREDEDEGETLYVVGEENLGKVITSSLLQRRDSMRQITSHSTSIWEFATKEEKAALTIQCAWRCHVARGVVVERMFEVYEQEEEERRRVELGDLDAVTNILALQERKVHSEARRLRIKHDSVVSIHAAIVIQRAFQNWKKRSNKAAADTVEPSSPGKRKRRRRKKGPVQIKAPSSNPTSSSNIGSLNTHAVRKLSVSPNVSPPRKRPPTSNSGSLRRRSSIPGISLGRMPTTSPSPLKRSPSVAGKPSAPGSGMRRSNSMVLPGVSGTPVRKLPGAKLARSSSVIISKPPRPIPLSSTSTPKKLPGGALRRSSSFIPGLTLPSKK